MSTSATQSGTRARVGGSGRGLGIASAALAVVIAAGFVFAVNQGNEATVSAVEARINEPAFQAESDRLTGLAEHWIQTNPENWPSELKRIYEMIAVAEARVYPGTNPEVARMANSGQLSAGGAVDYPGANPELTRMANSGQLDVTEAGNLQQRLAHEFLEEQRSAPRSGEPNPLQGRAE
jgi:hypothetical protein